MRRTDLRPFVSCSSVLWEIIEVAFQIFSAVVWDDTDQLGKSRAAALTMEYTNGVEYFDRRSGIIELDSVNQ